MAAWSRSQAPAVSFRRSVSAGKTLDGRDGKQYLICSCQDLDKTTTQGAGVLTRYGAFQQESVQAREQAVPAYLNLGKDGAQFFYLDLFGRTFVRRG